MRKRAVVLWWRPRGQVFVEIGEVGCEWGRNDGEARPLFIQE